MTLPCLSLLALGAAAQTAAQAGSTGELFVTAKDTGDRLTRKAPLVFHPLPGPQENLPLVLVDPRKTFQTLVGIGGALTDASAETWARLPPEQQQRLLTAYFDPDKGIGYSLGRTTIHSCDFSSGSYTYDDDPADRALEKFSVAHDRTARLPFLRAALAAARGGLRIYASPWSPPAWMKTNGSMLRGGKLDPGHAEVWARYITKFVQAYESEGIPIWGLTVQNEPAAAQAWESCLYSGEEERDFVRDHLGPALEGAGLGRVRLLIWDHNRGLLYQRAKAVYDDPKAARFIWGAAFHWYVGDHFDNVRMVHDAWPDKHLLFTEGTVEAFDAARLHDWAWGERYGTSILHDLNNWSEGWTDWNVLLDQRGGPNHVGNFCFAPVHADTATGALTFLSSYWYLGHFSKFLRPGARRVAVSTTDDRLLATAFKNPDGKVAVVVQNLREVAIPLRVWIDGQAAEVHSPARSILTVVYESAPRGPTPSPP